MRVALLNETFTPGMGYLENLLPKYLARLGVEMHVVATDLPCYYRQDTAQDAYRGFAEPLPAGSEEQRDGYIVHVLGHTKRCGHMRMAGLREKLRKIRPEIIQTCTPIGWIALDAALLQVPLGYKLFTGCHHHASVFPLAAKKKTVWSAEHWRCFTERTLPGRLVSMATEKCHAITEDCAEVAVRFFGVPRRKIEICPLGVDTELFHPVTSEGESAARNQLRRKLGFGESETVCIYTGRFSADKNPLLLARAVEELRKQGAPYRGLFVGNGEQADEIQACEGSTVHPFVPVHELGVLYRAAEIGVWPAQESLSMLDAAACGLPVVANHTMQASERLEGNGVTYRLNDRADLEKILLSLRDAAVRREMGERGARKMTREFSWEAIARRRLADYEAALSAKGQSAERPVADRVPS